MNMIATMSDGPVCAIVTCSQLNEGKVPGRFGTNAVEASAASIAGMTTKSVHFASCDSCHAVLMHLGMKGSGSLETSFLSPEDPRAKLLCEITSVEAWGRPMDGPARVVGIVNVLSAAKMSEIGCVCFNCTASGL